MTETTSTRRTDPMKLGRKMKPTMKHRPAIWENMLGTVYARNAAGETRYFDYKWNEAVAFAGVTADSDPRTFKTDRGGNTPDSPRRGQRVLFVVDPS